MDQACVYIVASGRNGTLYTGVTSNLVQRIWRHKHEMFDGFSKKYSAHVLVWYEIHETMASAIEREKIVKGWYRAWKLELIETRNPNWEDLYEEVL